MDICAKQIRNNLERQLDWSWGEIICSNSQSWGAKRRVFKSKSNEKMLIGWEERAFVGAGRMDRFREDVNGAWVNDKE